MIEVEDKYVLDLFARLNSKKQKKVFKATLKKSANILIKETRYQLKKIVGKITNKHYYANKKKTYSLSKGVATNKGNDQSIKVHILGDFRLKFFEKGTKKRYTKSKYGKLHYVGKITAKFFFRTAQRLKEKEVFQSMNKLLSEQIMKIYKRK